jgi:hypothetical protein
MDQAKSFKKLIPLIVTEKIWTSHLADHSVKRGNEPLDAGKWSNDKRAPAVASALLASFWMSQLED